MTSRPLLRRSELPPLDRGLQDEDGEDAADLFNLVVISPCQIFISNDLPTSVDEIERTPCNITSFECFDEAELLSQGQEPPPLVTVQFDYELWHSNPEKFDETLLRLESSMLQHMATVFNLLECPLAASKTARGGNRRGLQVFTQEVADLFIGVDSTPIDVPDNENGPCIVPVQTSDKVNAVCQPMTGYFSANVNADLEENSTAEAAIRSGLLRLLRLGMMEDLYVQGDVRKVSFIGDRTNYQPPQVQTNNGEPAPSSTRGLGNVALAFIIIAAILAFLVGGFLVRRNVKKRRQEHDKGVVLEDLHLEEAESKDETYNKGFQGGNAEQQQGADVQQQGADVQGSLASTDELALQPQPVLFPVAAKSSGSEATDESGSDAPTLSTNESPEARSDASPTPNTVDLSSSEKQTVAAAELDRFLKTSTAASEGDGAVRSRTPPKKKKKRKKSPPKDPDSPDSMLAESLKTLDSIAEEPHESSVIEGSDDGRSLT